MDIEIEQLVIKSQAKDSAAFAQLYDIYSQRIFRYIKLKIQNLQQAEDILQDTFVKAWQGLPNFKTQGGNFSAWLYKIAGNAMNDYFRKLYRSPETLELNEQLDIAAPQSLLQQAIIKADIVNIKNALTQLPTAFRQVLELRFIQDFSVGETAKILDKSNLSVRIAQHRALKKLRGLTQAQNDNDYSKI